MTLAPGSTLGPYRIDALLGAGGMGEVYRAHDPTLDRDIAIKVLPPDAVTDPDRLRRFEQEAKTVAALNHPNIVTIYSVEQAGDVRFLTMELVKGRPVADLLPPHGLSLDRLLAIAVPLAEAVAAAHARDIVHRDLKPTNVMVTTEGRVKVLDFGVAKLRPTTGLPDVTTVASPATADGQVVGTVAYMSPEQAEGRSVDHRTDIFSLGVMLYELATGRRPFSGDSPASLVSSVLRDTPPPVSDSNPALPPALDRIVRTCLRKDPDRRYQSAKDVRNELETLKEELDSGQLGAAPPAVRARSGRRWTVAAVALAAVALVAAAYFLFVRAPASVGDVPPSAVFVQLTTTDSLEAEPHISPDGQWVAYSSDATGNWDVYLQSISGRNPINLTAGTPEDDRQPAFSPDGQLIAFSSSRSGGGIFVMGRTGESPRRLTDRGVDPAWSPDGKEIVFSSQTTDVPNNLGGRSELWIVNVQTGATRQLIEGVALNPAWSPDGRLIAYWGTPLEAAQGGPGMGAAHRDIRIVPATGGPVVMVTDDAANDWKPVWSPDGRALYFASDRSGSMNLWRVAIDPSSGRPSGQAVPLTAPSPYVADLAVSGDGRRLVYLSTLRRSNIERVAFDAARTRVGAREAVTTGSRLWITSAVSPDGRQVALAQQFIGQEDIYVVAAAGGEPRQLTNDVYIDRRPTWSPDGSEIAFYSNRSGTYEIWAVATDGGRLRQLTHAAPAQALWPTWSHDGSRLMYIDFLGSMFMFDPRKPWTGQSVDKQAALPRGVLFRPSSWSPDGSRIAGDMLGGRGSMAIYEVEGRRYQDLPEGGAPTWLDDFRIVYVEQRTHQIRLLDSRNGQQTTLLTTAPGERLGMVEVAPDQAFIYFSVFTIQADVWLAELDRRR